MRCSVCRGHGHNARSCPTTNPDPSGVIKAIMKFGPMDPNAPILVSLRKHAKDDRCGICANTLARHSENPGEIKVFMEVCGEGQRAIRDTPEPKEIGRLVSMDFMSDGSIEPLYRPERAPRCQHHAPDVVCDECDTNQHQEPNHGT